MTIQPPQVSCNLLSRYILMAAIRVLLKFTKANNTAGIESNHERGMGSPGRKVPCGITARMAHMHQGVCLYLLDWGTGKVRGWAT